MIAPPKTRCLTRAEVGGQITRRSQFIEAATTSRSAGGYNKEQGNEQEQTERTEMNSERERSLNVGGSLGAATRHRKPQTICRKISQPPSPVGFSEPGEQTERTETKET